MSRAMAILLGCALLAAPAFVGCSMTIKDKGGNEVVVKPFFPDGYDPNIKQTEDSIDDNLKFYREALVNPDLPENKVCFAMYAIRELLRMKSELAKGGEPGGDGAEESGSGASGGSANGPTGGGSPPSGSHTG